ncbi:MAG: ribosome-associated translation inhibitor RaiA [Bdellovibrionaceae bacterium]|nr:ribosome-associated translation inhibitor RaiA [Bdellovibrionales bacterium]MCB9253170.1 ribosome-associated translation inhibitor RaiA [Pseudobdellovibrionaceae bacterium]
MSIRFAFHQLDPSPALCQYTEEKLLGVVGKLTKKAPMIHVTFSRRRRDSVAHCDVLGAYGTDLHAEVKAPSLYGAVNQMTEKLRRQLKRHKDKMKHHKSHAKQRADRLHSIAEHHNLVFVGERAAVPLPL